MSRNSCGRYFGLPPRNRPTHTATTIATIVTISWVSGLTAGRLLRAGRSPAELYPQEAAQGHAAAERRDGHARQEQQHDQKREVDRVRRRDQGKLIRQRVDEGFLGDRQEEDREDP